LEKVETTSFFFGLLMVFIPLANANGNFFEHAPLCSRAVSNISVRSTN
jgi:hypothetical protein